MATKTKIDIEVTPEMLAAGLQVLVDSGVLDQAAGTELPTGADEVLVTDIYKAMARARHSAVAVEVTLPRVGHIGPFRWTTAQGSQSGLRHRRIILVAIHVGLATETILPGVALLSRIIAHIRARSLLRGFCG
jgi:hypothetical protein